MSKILNVFKVNNLWYLTKFFKNNIKGRWLSGSWHLSWKQEYLFSIMGSNPIPSLLINVNEFFF